MFLDILIALNIILMIIVVFTEKKNSSEALAWLLVLTFLPVVGFILFIFFGSTLSLKMERLSQKRNIINNTYSQYISTQLAKLSTNEEIITSPDIEKYKDIIYMLANKGRGFYTDDNKIELLLNAQKKYPKLFADISSAKHSIHMEYFIIKTKDDSGKMLLSLLAKKAKQGVEVRVIYDRLGDLKISNDDFKELTDAGGKVYGFLPNPFLSFLRMNYRNHRKIVVIDGKIGYTGGINIGDDYLGLDPKRTPWRDTHMRLTGSSVSALQIQFINDWLYLEGKSKTKSEFNIKQEFFPLIEKHGTVGAQIVASGPDCDNQNIRDGYIKLINSAKHKIYIQTPYLIPDNVYMTSLKLAAASGVDVRVMVPGIPDKSYVYHVTYSYIEELLKSNIKVYTHKGFLHAKSIVVDDTLCSIGTTNVDIRSFQLNYEINAFVYDKEFSRNCTDMFMIDINDCKELTLREFERRGFFKKALEAVLRLFSPLM